MLTEDKVREIAKEEAEKIIRERLAYLNYFNPSPPEWGSQLFPPKKSASEPPPVEE